MFNKLHSHKQNRLLASLSVAAILCLVLNPTSLGAPPARAQAPASETWIANDRLVLHPAFRDFSVQQFLDARPGVLKDQTVDFYGQPATVAEVIEFFASYYSLNPQVLLAMIELQSGLLDDPSPSSEQLDYALGYRDPAHAGFAPQLAWAAQGLFDNFYSRLYAVSGSGYMQAQSTNADAGDLALQAVLSVTRSPSAAMATKATQDFASAYVRLFGAASTLAPMTISTVAGMSGLRLPWTSGETWYYTGGPHTDGWSTDGPWGHRTSSSTWSAVDFAPGGGGTGSWITAAASGNIRYSDRALIAIDHTGGWSSLYFHVSDSGRRGTGSVGAGEQIGHPSCNTGGWSGVRCTGTHLHFSTTLNGYFQTIDGTVISGWTIHATSHYNGTMTNGNQTRVANQSGGAGAALVSDNSTDSDDARTLGYGQSLHGNINPSNDKDTYYFNGSSGQRATIRMNRDSGTSLDSFLELYKPDGGLLGVNDDSDGSVNSRLTQDLPQNGTYRIVARSWSSASSGGYTLNLNQESAGDGDDNRWLSMGQSLGGTISPNNDRDLYYFNTTAGRAVSIRMNKTSGSGLDCFLELYSPGGVKVAENDDGGGNTDSWIVYVPSESGAFRLLARSYHEQSSGGYVISLSGINSSNLARGKPAYADSTEAWWSGAGNATDGNLSTRWSSRFSDPNGIWVDLGSNSTVDRVILKWETAYGRSYGIYVAVPGDTSWRNVYWTNSGDGGTDTITFSPTTARWVLMWGYRRGTPWGYSLWEFEVYNTAATLIPMVPPDSPDKPWDTITSTVPLAPTEPGKEVMLVGDGEFGQEDMPLIETETTSTTVGIGTTVMPPTATITYVTPSVARWGQVITFAGRAEVDLTGGAPITGYVWISDLAGGLSNQDVFTMSAADLPPGVHVVSFMAQDERLMWSEPVTATLEVLPPFLIYLPIVMR